MSSIRLTPTSYIVLGLIERGGESTPYQLKRLVAAGLGNFWSLQHAQLYSEPERLAKAGLLDEDVETTGRRRKTYRITAAGLDVFPRLADVLETSNYALGGTRQSTGVDALDTLLADGVGKTPQQSATKQADIAVFGGNIGDGDSILGC